MSNVDLLRIVKAELTRPRHPAVIRNPTFYPSAAAVTDSSGVTYGACGRADWYRIAGVPPSDLPPLYMVMTYHLGKAIELKLVEGMKQAGIFEAEGVKFFIPRLNVSGELDVVGRYRREDRSIGYYIVECKSVYGMGAMATISGRSRAWNSQPAFDPYPKESNLMQTMIYLGEFSLTTDLSKRMDFAKLVYIPRDKPVDGREFTVTLITRDSLSGKLREEYAEKMTPGEHYALVTTDGFPDKVETRFSLEDIHRNFERNLRMIERNEIIPRAFRKFYTPEMIEAMYQSGDIGKTVYEAWVKASRPAASLKHTPGHYLCQSYCEWRNFCYKANGAPNPEADAVVLSQRRENVEA